MNTRNDTRQNALAITLCFNKIKEQHWPSRKPASHQWRSQPKMTLSVQQDFVWDTASQSTKRQGMLEI